MVEKGGQEHRNNALGELVWLPLTPRQTRWVQLDKLYGTANCQTMARMRFQGRLDHQALRAALARLIARYAILRSRIAFADRAARQYLGAPCEDGALKEYDVEGRWGAERICRREAENPLRLNGGTLVRATLIRLPDREYILVLVAHPVICDSASIRYLLWELLVLYRMAVAGARNIELKQTEDYFQNHVLAEHIRYAGEMSKGEREYWHRMFASVPEPLGASPSHARRHVAQRWQKSLQIQRETVAKLAERYCISQYEFCAITWAVVFLRWQGLSEVVGGIEAADAQCHVPVGPIRTLIPIRFEATADVRVERLIREAACSIRDEEQRSLCGAWEEILGERFGKGSCPQVMQFAVSSTSLPGLVELQEIQVPALTINEVSSDFRWPCAAISIAIDEVGATPAVVVTYSPDVVDHNMVERAVECWQSQLQQISG